MATGMPNWLKQRAFLTPERTALIFENRTWTFAKVYEEAAKRTAALYKRGFSKGDRIGLLIRNTPEAVVLIHAMQQLGASAILLNSRLTAGELVWQLKDAEAAAMIYDPAHEGIAKDIQAELPCIESVQLSGEEMPVIREEFSLEDTCSIMYTSGTTGKPKGVRQTYGNHWWSAAGSAFNLGVSERDCWICSVPLFHISGYSILMRSVIYGVPIRLHERFNEDEINAVLKQGEGTIMSVVAATLSRLLRSSEGSYHENFRGMLLGGGPAPKPILEECAERGIPVFQTYGMTETSSQIATLSPEYSLTKLGSAGKPLFPCQLRIAAEGGEAPYKEGEILVKGPNVTVGYLNREEANKEAFVGGWFHTGDIGYVDEEGFLFVLDRRSDLIISGGENIYPAEVESVLLDHPAVIEAGVTGVTNEKWGQVPAAFIVEKEPVEEEELRRFCQSRLAKYKCPAYFIKVEGLPRNASNKLLRRELRNQFERDTF
ncbi:o-succinylbenzoate--CoA ligase [Bacillus thermotolerans]|uniref:2-succinylbenzoate--CoA ligase n=1 Tax=Bacillus thermotolerans TaxID=1221996 RepID=A0A0F5I9G2_BACTR|nr:o-succinylbenzoate--CoA ligase [Bacillus thermotolerans]KKB35228.1 O-succinylbenzoic acid--CoA ligase [Bacillus thermotolerans]KKB42058.1 O-succinylbenzoic acid--CoA ligase [Bacillus thermotolerans]